MATPKQIAQDIERWDNGDGTNSVRVVNKDGSVISAGGGGGTSSADKGGFTEGTSTFTPSGGVFNDGLTAIASGLGAWFRITALRALHVNLRDSSGNEVPTVTAQPGVGTRGLAVWVGNPGSGSSGGTSSNFGSADPAAGTAAGFSDGTNMREARVADVDTGAGTEYALEANLRISASGGSIEAKGQQAMASSIPTVIASDQSKLPVKAASGDLADGADTTQGALADAIVAAGASGSVSAKLRRVTQGLEDLKTLIVLAAGSAIIGKVGIDQTTPGTTDSVTVATAQGAGATIGVTSGAAVTTDVAGTLQQYLRGLAKAFLANVTFTGGGALKGDVTTIAGTAPTTVGKLDVKSADGDQATLGITTGAAVIGDNAGTLQQYLRGLAKAIAAIGTAASNALTVTITPNTNGGWSKVKYAAQTTTVQTVKGSAGTFGAYIIYNPNTGVAYVQIFDTAGAVTLGTTVPDWFVPIPGGATANVEFTNGINHASGIKLACTTTATGNAAPTTGLDLSVFYK